MKAMQIEKEEIILPIFTNGMTISVECPNPNQSLCSAMLSHFSSVQLCVTLDGSPPGSQSLGFSRQEHWSGLPFPSPMHESEK